MFDVLGWLNYLLDSFKNIVWGVFQSIFTLFKDFFFWLVDTILGFVVSVISSLGMPDMSGIPGAWGSLPGEVIWMAHAAGVDVAAGMIVSAMIVRLVLMAIPFIW